MLGPVPILAVDPLPIVQSNSSSPVSVEFRQAQNPPLSNVQLLPGTGAFVVVDTAVLVTAVIVAGDVLAAVVLTLCTIEQLPFLNRKSSIAMSPLKLLPRTPSITIL